MEYKKGKKIDKSHAAVFPEELVATILKNFTNENDIIYYPFMGTGTTASFSSKLNRNWVGSEIDEKYCEIVMSRVASEKFLLFD